MLTKIKLILSFITILSQEPNTVKLHPAISESASLPELMVYYNYKITPVDSVHVDVTKGTLVAQKSNY